MMSDVFFTFRWWVTLLALGTAVWPLTWRLFNRLPDRGYAFTKMVGVLLVSYLFWILGSVGFVGNNLGGILLALGVVTAVSLRVLTQQPTDLKNWLGQNWRYILLTELLFLLMFAGWAWIRAQHPAIEATEKPMEFAFLNAAVRTPTFPPIDPWLSGFAISYYYFGYVMSSVITRLAVVPTVVAFNLTLAWLAAGTAVGAFGLVYNLVASRGEQARKTAVLLGLIAALAIPSAGNLQIILEQLYANRDRYTALWTIQESAFSALNNATGRSEAPANFWLWLDVTDINTPQNPTITPRYESPSWWWWRSSRPITEVNLNGEPVAGLEPIIEFPAFSFILGDIHPHVLALPFALLSLALAFAWWKEAQVSAFTFRLTSTRDATSGSQLSLSTLASLLPNWPLYLFTVVLMGGLSFLNTWDVLIHLFVLLGAFLIGSWQRYGWSRDLLTQTVIVALMIGIPAILLYLPFYLGFRSQAGAPFLLPTLQRPIRLPHFLIVFGLPLSSIVPLMLALGFRQRFRQWRTGLLTAVSLILGLLLLMLLLAWVVAASAEGAGRVAAVAEQVGRLIPPRPPVAFAPGWATTAVFTILPAVLTAKLALPGMVLLLSAIVALCVMVWKEQFPADKTAVSATDAPASPLPFVLLLILTGSLLTLGPEFVYLRDNFGFRLNTIFKFYYQAWVMFGIAALLAIDILLREMRRRLTGWGTAVVYALLLAGALQFPLIAAQTRAIEYRGFPTAENRLPPTLDGLARLQAFNQDEYDAIMWLQNNVDGLPVVLEATGGAYSSYGRVSANTGLPTVLGWANHQYQWRGSGTPEPAERDPVIRDIYQRPFWDNTGALLDRYNVAYIYVGGLEINTYGSNGTLPGREKFDELLEVAYQNNSVTIYRWQPESD